MLLVTLALKTLLSFSQNGISPITLNKQLGNHLNMDIKNASKTLPSALIFNQVRERESQRERTLKLFVPSFQF